MKTRPVLALLVLLSVAARAQFPDLSANGVSGPLSAAGSQVVNVTRDITNIGTFVSSFSFSIYLSTNATISTSDILVATFTNQTGFGPQVVQVTVPPAIGAGTYFWGLLITPATNEQNTANNTVASAQTVNISAGPPDLVAMSLSGPAIASPGQVVSLTRNISNAGGPIVGGVFGYEIYLSTNNVISTTDLLIATFNSTTLGSLSVNVTIPSGLATGAYFLGMICPAEPGEVVLNNNIILGNSINIALIPPTITSVSPSAGPPGGGTTVVITGTAYTGTPQVRFNGALAANVVVNSATQITCTSPANPVGQPLVATVSVQTTSGTATAAGAYTYNAPLPGSGVDLVLQTGINGTPNQNPSKFAQAGNILSIHLISPGGAFTGFLPLIGVQFYAFGNPPFGIVGFPQVHIDPVGGVILFNGQLAFGAVFPLPSSGILLNYQVPAGLNGFALRVQGFVLIPTTPGFVTTDGHDILFN